MTRAERKARDYRVAPRSHPMTGRPLWMIEDAEGRDQWHLGGPWRSESEAVARLAEMEAARG